MAHYTLCYVGQCVRLTYPKLWDEPQIWPPAKFVLSCTAAAVFGAFRRPASRSAAEPCAAVSHRAPFRAQPSRTRPPRRAGQVELDQFCLLATILQFSSCDW